MRFTSYVIFYIILILFFSCKKNSNGPPLDTPKDTLKITSVSPTSGPYGIDVVITGTHFNIDTSKIAVSFNGKKGTIKLVNEDSLVVVVPKGAGTGPINVSVDGSTIVGPEFKYVLSATVSTFAGNGIAGYADGDTSVAEFSSPRGIKVDLQGNIYICDTEGNRIRKISHGIVTTFAGTGDPGYLDGSSSIAKFWRPQGMAIDKLGNIYVTDGFNVVRKITPSGTVSGFAGSGGHGAGTGYLDGREEDSEFNGPYGVTADSGGNNIFVADVYNSRIRKVNGGLVSTYAGNGTRGYIEGVTEFSEFYFPTGITMDKSGNLFVTDQFNFCIRKIGIDGLVTTIAGGVKGYKDGPAATAEFDYMTGIAIDSKGNIYVSDGRNNCIRKIGTDGVVSTLAGNGAMGYVDGAAIMSEFNGPSDLAIDQQGNIYVADTGGNRIRKIVLEQN